MPKALTILLVVTLFCLFSYSQTSTYAEQTLIKNLDNIGGKRP